MSSIGANIDSSNWDTICQATQSSDVTYIEVNGYRFPVQNGQIVENARAESLTPSAAIHSFAQDSQTFIENTVGTAALAIRDYIAPTKLGLDALDEIGKTFDDIIKDTFITQMFNIRGADILCASFCVLVSFLDCSTRNSLYEAILFINNASNMAANVVSDINEMVKTYNAVMVSAETVASAAEALFRGEPEGIIEEQSTGMNVAMAGSTIHAAGDSIRSIVDNISKTIRLISHTKMNLPIGINGRIWDLASAVLFELQGMAVEFADEAISNITNPIEDMIRDIQPPICVGNLAGVFFNRLIDIVRTFKGWILQLIAELFTANNAFNLEFKAFNIGCQGLLELLAFMDGLNLALTRFGDLAIGCGIQPCNQSSPSRAIVDSLRAGTPIPTPNPSGAIVRPIEELATPDNNIESLAEQLAPTLGGPEKDIYVTPNKLIVSQPFITDAPKKIADLINNEDVLKSLGPDYTIFTSPDNKNATVVYSFNRVCGGIGE